MTAKKYKNAFLNSIRKLFRLAPFEKIICAFSQNKNLDSFIGKLIPENNLYPSNTIRKATRNEINYLLDISDYQNWLIYFGINDDTPDGLYELVKKKSVIIDIGSNIGQTAMNFAKLAGQNSLVFGFEPDPVNYSKMTKNLSLNNFKNIQYFNIGLGAQDGELPFKINSPLNRGGNRIGFNDAAECLSVKIESLDNFLKTKKINRVDLIKIDVEGYELEVLKGAKETLEKYHPVLYVEVDDNNLKEQFSNAKTLVHYISDFGYTSIHAKTKQTVNDSYDMTNCHFDIICKPYF